MRMEDVGGRRDSLRKEILSQKSTLHRVLGSRSGNRSFPCPFSTSPSTLPSPFSAPPCCTSTSSVSSARSLSGSRMRASINGDDTKREFSSACGDTRSCRILRDETSDAASRARGFMARGMESEEAVVVEWEVRAGRRGLEGDECAFWSEPLGEEGEGGADSLDSKVESLCLLLRTRTMRRLGGLERGGEVVGAVCTIVSLDSPEESPPAESEEMATGALRRFLRDPLREGGAAFGVLGFRSWRWPFVALL